jgi:hypothetical protein
VYLTFQALDGPFRGTVYYFHMKGGERVKAGELFEGTTKMKIVEIAPPPQA